jgi:uncharacterized protein (DUF1501 family)
MSEQPRKWIDTRDKPGLLFAMMREFAINSHMSKMIKEILFRAAERIAVHGTLVANRLLNHFRRIFNERDRGIRPLGYSS